MIGGHFEDIAASLEHHKGMTLVDGTHCHAWSLPPWEYMEPLSEAGQCPSGGNAGAMLPLSQFLPQTCNCGLIRAKDLSSHSVWHSAGGALLQCCVSPDGGTLGATTVATTPSAAAPSDSTAADLSVMDSFGAKRQTLLCVANLLANLITVADVI